VLIISPYRCVYRKYPKIVDRVIEEDPIEVPSDEDAEGMVKIPVDITGKNPNGVEFDNLYLDVS
jgi:5'-3' exonuclease